MLIHFHSNIIEVLMNFLNKIKDLNLIKVYYNQIYKKFEKNYNVNIYCHI
jgi:hypothetical protein